MPIEENTSKLGETSLFRFESIRNPNLTETNKVNLGFIQRAEEAKGFFDDDSITSTKLNALIKKAIAFESDAIKSVEEVEKGTFKELLKIGRSISNLSKLSSKDIKLCEKLYSQIKKPSDLKSIWDNLIYQYLTQNDFYVKEALTHILKVYHIGYVQTLQPSEELYKINGDDFTKKALSAVIVLPHSIFETNLKNQTEKREVANTLSAREHSLLELDIEKFEKEQESSIYLECLEQLKLELEAIKDCYDLNYNKALIKAKEEYNDKYAKKIEAYNKLLEEVDFSLNLLEENEKPDEQLLKLINQLEKLEVPAFDFPYKDELNWEDITEKLSDESLECFIENFSTKCKKSELSNEPKEKETVFSRDQIKKIKTTEEISIEEEIIGFRFNNFDAVFTEIDNQLYNNYTSLLNEKKLQQTSYANVGNVMVPVNTISAIPVTHLAYTLKAIDVRRFFTRRKYVTFRVYVENTSWSITNAVVTAQTTSGNKNQNISGIQVINNVISFPRILNNGFSTINNFKIDIFFSNGRETTLELANLENNKLYTGILRLKLVDGIGDPIDDDTPIENPQTGVHFGVKRLGVSEYMKVVQSVHAYVPGEVSNIENVMASELRHKSINELTRTEDTLTTTKTEESEKISDSTKVDRVDMQQEVAKEIDRQKSINAHANFTYKGTGYKLEVGGAYASTNAQHIANRQSVTKSQEITERAMERVQSKITEERIQKIIQEVSLTNVHEYDNRGDGTNVPQHITGVYRWVDKKMKNQIYNYGKRAMFEFMIPEPARLHRLALAVDEHTLTPPIDPRKAPVPHTMKNATLATDALLDYWAGIYGVQLTPKIANSKQISHNAIGRPNTDNGFSEVSRFQIPDNYIGNTAIFSCRSQRNRGGGWEGSRYSRITFSNLKVGVFERSQRSTYINFNASISGLNINGEIDFNVNGHNVDNYNIKITVNCLLSQEYINAWKLENFNAIIEAYKNALDEYKEEVAAIEAEQKAKAEEQKDSIGNFYRIIESDILKHNCIAYLLQNYLVTLGQDFTDGDKMLNFKVNLNEKLDKYTATAKFLEQAFEWSIKDYTFYPYYWADREQWQEMYLTENSDYLFRSFLQAGLARVIVTVKPGFEEAVQYFLETGQVWLGGETPIIGDPLYMSIIDEVREPTGVAQGNYWITRIPTTLTILQSKSTGLEVERALPIYPEPVPENCENPEQLETDSVFSLNDVQLSRTGDGETTLPSNIVAP